MCELSNNYIQLFDAYNITVSRFKTSAMENVLDY